MGVDTGHLAGVGGGTCLGGLILFWGCEDGSRMAEKSDCDYSDDWNSALCLL